MHSSEGWRILGLGPVKPLRVWAFGFNMGALISRMGLWGPLYYKSNKEPQNTVGYLGPYSRGLGFGSSA